MNLSFALILVTLVQVCSCAFQIQQTYFVDHTSQQGTQATTIETVADNMYDVFKRIRTKGAKIYIDIDSIHSQGKV